MEQLMGCAFAFVLLGLVVIAVLLVVGGLARAFRWMVSK